MNELLQVVIGIGAGIVISVGVLWGIDLEVARQDYNKNVELCKPIDGCLFNSSCDRYNDMIEQKCK